MQKFPLEHKEIFTALKESVDIKSFQLLDAGNMNYLYRIFTPHDSLILKYAPPYLKMLGSSAHLDQKRIITEVKAIEYFLTLLPEFFVPIVSKNECLYFFAMEDKKEHTLLQDAFKSKKVHPKVFESLGEFIATTLNRSVKEYRLQENSALKQVTLDYVFTYPFEQKSHYMQPLDFFRASFRSPKALHGVESLKKLFMQTDDSYIHGDLHTGSVLVHEEDIAIIDLEFACFGPSSFDLGVLLAHMVMDNIALMLQKKDLYFDTYLHTLYKSICIHVNLEEKQKMEFFSQSLGFCGVELARRLVVPAKSLSMLGPPEDLQKISFKVVDAIAKELLENYENMHSFTQLFKLVKKHL